MTTKLATLALTAYTILTGLAAHASAADEQAATTASSKWLGLVDKGQYGQSWGQASQYFKNAVKKPQWESQVSAVRSPLGKVVQRKLKSAQLTNTLPGAPDGEYVVIQYDTSFEKKNAAVETITPMKEKTGEWRVSGYFIK